jgi:hypothetical protein
VLVEALNLRMRAVRRHDPVDLHTRYAADGEEAS